jgi:hypothetical protein
MISSRFSFLDVFWARPACPNFDAQGASFWRPLQPWGCEGAPSASDSKTELSRFKFAGFNFRTMLNTEEEKLAPRKEALVWDSVLS